MLRLSLPAIPTIFKTPRCLPLHLVASPRLPSLSYRFPSSSCSFSSICSAYAEPNQNSAAAEVDDDEEESGFDEELRKLLALLPEGMRKRAGAHPELHQLVEIVMDLGRRPLARFPSGDFVLSDDPITLNDLHHATSQAGDFTADNRAGISRTLHRISAIKNRKGAIIGLTCRVGRAVSGSANLLRDLIEDGASLLLIGPPGVGKTTVIREVGRMLADDLKKRVMIVDTSNEIGGDGDVPHAGIGSARRMQVPNPDLQHRVLIEAVENHMPQVIVIDEIGTRLEAAAASTIAQRGIQLIASAHGVTIENLTMNPSLEMLVGGVQSVTLGDDEASRRGVQKTVLERKGPATFSCAVEIVSKNEMRVHHSLEATVDALLSGRPPSFEIRTPNSLADIIADDSPYDDTSAGMVDDEESLAGKASIRVYTYGILEKSIIQAITKLRLDELVQLTDGIGEANALLALQSKLKKNTPILTAAKSQGTPVYTIKTCSLPQISKVLRVIVAELNDPHRRGSPEEVEALEEARLAVEQVVIPMGRPMDLLPRPAHVVAAQIELVREYGLSYEEVGEEPNAHHLRVLPIHWEISSSPREDVEAHNGVPRLPLLPE